MFRRIIPRRGIMRGDDDAEDQAALNSPGHDDSSFDSNEFQMRRTGAGYASGGGAMGQAATPGSRLAQLFRSLPGRVRRSTRSRLAMAPSKHLGGLLGTVHSSPFQWCYWRHLRQIDKPSSCWFRAPSSVKEIIYFAACNWTVLICAGGDIVALVNDPITPRVAWSGRVLMTGLDGLILPPASSVKLKRAVFDPASERLYFTQSNHAGIFYARLGEIRNTVVHQPKTFVARSKTREKFGALAIDSRYNVLICCNSHKRTASLTFWSTDANKHQVGQDVTPLAEIPCNSLLMPTGPAQRELLSIRPHKCACLSRAPDNSQTGNNSTLVAIVDKHNSALYLFRASYISAQHGGVKFEYVATVASKAQSDLRRPRAVHFDPAGNLIVADDGPLHSRLQFFSLTDKGMFEPDNDQLLTSSIYRSVFAPIKCVSASMDVSTRKPFVLCGVSGFIRFPGIRKLGTSGEVACFCYEDYS